jgi:hypothetical protein
MEGSCVFNESGSPAAILLPPVRHHTLGTELYFAVPLELLCSAVHQQTSIRHPNWSPSVEHQTPLQEQEGVATAGAQPNFDTVLMSEGSSKQDTDVLQRRFVNEQVPPRKIGARNSLALPSCAADSSSMASVPPVRGMLQVACAAEHQRRTSAEVTAAVADVAARATVLIECGGSWASGVILDAAAGICMTAAHAVSPSKPITVRYS